MRSSKFEKAMELNRNENGEKNNKIRYLKQYIKEDNGNGESI